MHIAAVDLPRSLIHNYITDRKQRVKVNGSFDAWTKNVRHMDKERLGSIARFSLGIPFVEHIPE